MVSGKKCQKIFRFNTSEVKALLWAYYNRDLAKFNEGYIQGCKAITYQAPNGVLLMAYIHQEEMDALVEHFRTLKTSRACRWLDGWWWYCLLVWTERIAERSKGYEDMPPVRDEDITRAITELMKRYYKKVGDRFGH